MGTQTSSSGMGTRRLGLVAALLLAVSALAPPGVGSADAGQPRGPAMGEAPDLSYRQEASEATTAGSSDPATRSGGDFAAAAEATASDLTFVDTYKDYCEDGSGAGPDLERMEFADDRANSGAIGILYGFCEPLTVADLAGGVVTRLSVGPYENYLVDAYAADGQLMFRIYDVEYDVVLGTGPAELSDDGRSLFLAFPESAIAYAPGFMFVAFSLDARLDEADRMPQQGEPEGIWPGSCDTAVFGDLLTVTPRGDARAQVEQAGFQPTSVARDGSFHVRVRDEGDRAAIASLPGVADVHSATQVAGGDEPPSPAGRDGQLSTAAARDAWWHLAVGADRVDARGAGVEVAVLDTGVDGTRGGFGSRVASGFDAVAGRSIPAGVDSARGSHGTHVAGIVGADGSQVTGIAPAATIRPFQVFQFDGCATDLSIASAVDEAAAMGVDVLNLSLGSHRAPIPTVESALRRAADAGVVVVAASGNSGRNEPEAMAQQEEVLAVGATDPSGQVASYSTSGSWLDMVAPGGGMDRGIVSLAPRGGTTEERGTSMAAPVVSGAAALHIGEGGEATADALRQTANPLGSEAWTAEYGHGLLDIPALLEGLGEPDGPNEDPDPAPGEDQGSFSDVGPDHRFFDEIEWMAERGLSEGFSDGTFRPGTTVTRQAMMVFLHGLAGAPEGPFDDPGFSDVGAGHRFYEEIAWAAQAGITGGYADGTFRPGAELARQAGVAFLHGLATTADDGPGDDAAPADVQFDDVDGEHPFATEIAWAVENGITEGYADGTFRPGATMTRLAASAFLHRWGASDAEG